MRRASMKQRMFVAAVSAGAAARPLRTRAQQARKALIGFVGWWPPKMASHLDALGLRTPEALLARADVVSE